MLFRSSNFGQSTILGSTFYAYKSHLHHYSYIIWDSYEFWSFNSLEFSFQSAILIQEHFFSGLFAVKIKFKPPVKEWVVHFLSFFLFALTLKKINWARFASILLPCIKLMPRITCLWFWLGPQMTVTEIRNNNHKSFGRALLFVTCLERIVQFWIIFYPIFV